MTTTEQPTVRPGQVWQDTDPRHRGRLLRFLRVETIESYLHPFKHVQVPVAVCSSWWAERVNAEPETPARKVRVRVSRFRPTNNGYRLVSDAPEEAPR